MAFVTIKDKDNAILGHLQTDAQERLGVHNLLHVQDQKPSGTDGGAFTTGAWRTRDLNTILTNNIVGASLALNQITLPAGRYYCEASAPSITWNLDARTVAKLRNITASEDMLYGQGTRISAGSGLGGTLTFSNVSGAFEIAEETVIELQHTSMLNSSVFGNASSAGIPEIYSDLKIWKLS